MKRRKTHKRRRVLIALTPKQLKKIRGGITEAGNKNLIGGWLSKLQG